MHAIPLKLKYAVLFMCLFTLLVFTLSGCKESDRLQPIQVVIKGDPKVSEALEQILEQNPQITVVSDKSRYSIQVVKPDSASNYKILQVTPDPKYNYRVVVIDPESGNEVIDLSRQLGSTLKEKLKKKKGQSSD